MIPGNHDHQRSRNPSPERSWVEKCLGCTCLQLFWPRVVIRKWLNISTKSSDYSADSDDSINLPVAEEALRFKDKTEDDFQGDPNGGFRRSRRRKSETFRAQFIDTKELRVSVNTWNLGGEVPPEDLDIRDWLDTDFPADIYVIGFQEIIPLIAGNIFGSEDTTPIPLWENIIRDTLNKIQPENTKLKCYSDPPSPSRVKKPCDYAPNIKDDLLVETDSECDEEIYTFIDDSNFEEKVDSSKFVDDSLKASKSFKTYHPLESYLSSGDMRVKPKVNWLEKLDLDSIMKRKRKPQYVRIVSKQMVGVFLTIWVRRSLRKHIQNVHVSTVGVGVMNYIGNKGSISVSMSIYQTQFCFICTHLTSGEREVDLIKRNADVENIHRRTSFNSMSSTALPRTIRDHERIIWFGDLNYRLNLSYDETLNLISKNDWSTMLESDQLNWELKKGRAFDGWSEGSLTFPPTYKYEPNSEKYVGENPDVGRRIPAWCDRILSFGKGMRQMSYRRSEIIFSDHRPVSALYMIEVEDLSLRKLQKVFMVNDEVIESYGIIARDASDCDR